MIDCDSNATNNYLYKLELGMSEQHMPNDKPSVSSIKHGTRALSQKVTNASEGSLTPNIKNVDVTVQNKCKHMMPIVMVLNEIYLPIKF